MANLAELRSLTEVTHPLKKIKADAQAITSDIHSDLHKASKDLDTVADRYKNHREYVKEHTKNESVSLRSLRLLAADQRM